MEKLSSISRHLKLYQIFLNCELFTQRHVDFRDNWQTKLNFQKRQFDERRMPTGYEKFDLEDERIKRASSYRALRNLNSKENVPSE